MHPILINFQIWPRQADASLPPKQLKNAISLATCLKIAGKSNVP
jgi:hypothetical protein